MGVKEVIPFGWKIIGRSGDLILTLFKSIERKDAEAQHERLLEEGYYKDLAILENKEVVTQPKPRTPPPSTDKKSKTGAAPKKMDRSTAKDKSPASAKTKTPKPAPRPTASKESPKSQRKSPEGKRKK